MKFYELSKKEREQKYINIQKDILLAINNGDVNILEQYFSDNDTYIRKASYLSIGKINSSNKYLLDDIIKCLDKLFKHNNEKVRQTVIYSCGEISVYNFEEIQYLIGEGLIDSHHSVRNAVVGALKKAGDLNPNSILPYCKYKICSENSEIRRLICHGLELRGRTHPQDVIDILKLLQYEKVKKVRKMLIHVLGQISYKKGCLYYVSKQLKKWDNKNIYKDYKQEVIEVHGRYERFSEFTQEFVISFLEKN